MRQAEELADEQKDVAADVNGLEQAGRRRRSAQGAAARAAQGRDGRARSAELQ